MTARRKRQWIYCMAFPTLMFFKSDSGARRCLELLRSGDDSMIESVWNNFFKTAHEIQNEKKTRF